MTHRHRYLTVACMEPAAHRSRFAARTPGRLRRQRVGRPAHRQDGQFPARHRSLTAASAFMLLGAVLAGCGSSDPETSDAAEPIVLGTYTDLSGPAAAIGVGSTNASRMVFDRVNEEGGIHGRQVRFVVEDNQYQVPRAVQAANKLIHRDRIFAMVGALGTPMNNAVMTSQFEAGVPNIFPLSGARSMAEPLHRLKFAGVSTYYDQMRAAIRYFVEEKGKERVCTMTQDTDYGTEMTDAADDQLGEMGLEVIDSTAHKPLDTDFSAAILKLRQADCDLIVLGTIIGDTILAISAARAIDWDVEFVGPIAAFESEVAEAEGGVTNGFYAMTSFEFPYPDHPRQEVRDFVADYRERYGPPPNTGSLLGWLVADFTVRALRDAGPDLTVDSLVAAIESIDDYQDIFGGPVLSFGPEKRIGTDEAFLAEVQDGRWVRVTENLSY